MMRYSKFSQSKEHYSNIVLQFVDVVLSRWAIQMKQYAPV